MATIGQRVDTDTRLVCSRCGHMIIVKAGTQVRPCPACMNISFEAASSGPPPEPEEAADIGLGYGELEAHVSAVLRARSGLNRMQIDVIAEAVARAIEANNRKLQDDIESAFEEQGS